LEVFPRVKTGDLTDKRPPRVNTVAQQNTTNLFIIEEAILGAQGVYAWWHLKTPGPLEILLKVISLAKDGSIVHSNIRLQKFPSIRSRSAKV